MGDDNRIERPGTGWGRSDSGSGQTNEGCAVTALMMLVLPAGAIATLVEVLRHFV